MKVVFGILKYLFIVLVVSTLVGSVLGLTLMMYFSQGLPNIITTEDYKPATVTRIYGKGDTVVGEFFEERRYVVPLEQIPEITQKAFLAAEDDRFFEHQGIDLQGILRAAIANFRAGRVVQGGSTITQQVAKSLLLTPERSIFRKIKEVILANRMEKNLNKKQILHLYLNQIYLGQGAYGVEAAAQIYFNKNAKDLTLAESAILAGLPQAPSKYSPLTNPKLAKQRQTYVLRRLVEDGAVPADKMDVALKEPVKVWLTRDLNQKYAPYYVEYIRKHLLEKFGKDALYQGGLSVKTMLDPGLSIVARKSLRDGLRIVDKRQGYRGPIRSSKTPQEIETAIKDATEHNLAETAPFHVLQPDGSLAADAANRVGGDNPAATAFTENEIYQGVVTSVDDRKREVRVNLGFANGVMPFEKMAWAQILKPGAQAPEPLLRPSQAVAKGDLIWVRLVSKSDPKAGPGEYLLGLEQEPEIQGATLTLDVNSGQVLAMVGGYDFKESEFNRAIQAERQPGSVFKPIIYSAALDRGYTPATIIQDSPIVFNAGENEKWKPENFEEKFYGDTLFRSALIRSRNIPTIKIVQDIGVNYLIDYAVRLGLPDKFNRDLSISLGSSTASLMDIVRTYAIFPRGGRRLKPVFFDKIVDRDGRVVEENPAVSAAPPVEPVLPPLPKTVAVAGELQAQAQQALADARAGVATAAPANPNQPAPGVWVPDPSDPDRVMDPRTAFVMTHLMNEVATVGTGQGAKALGRPAAGKTGTTSENVDAWFVGFTPQVVTGVWVGFDALKTIGTKATGGLIALPIWLDCMKEVIKSYPPADFVAPKGVTYAFIDSRTGKPSGANRPNAVREVFAEGTEPTAGGAARASAASASGTPGAQESRRPSPDTDDSQGDDFFKEDIQ